MFVGHLKELFPPLYHAYRILHGLDVCCGRPLGEKGYLTEAVSFTKKTDDLLFVIFILKGYFYQAAVNDIKVCPLSTLPDYDFFWRKIAELYGSSNFLQISIIKRRKRDDVFQKINFVFCRS